MRWAFWRAREREQPAQPEVATWPPPPERVTGSREEPDGDRPPTPAFSGASPQPGESGAAEGDLSSAAETEREPWDMAGMRADVVALVRAALERDTPAADRVVRQLGAREDDGAGMVSIAAMGALGDRLAASDAAVDDVEPAAAVVVARGDAVSARAAVPLRAVAPSATPDLVRFVVRLACGVPEHDPELLPLMETSSDDLARVAAGLLAQTVLDGQGDVDALFLELADLLPD